MYIFLRRIIHKTVVNSFYHCQDQRLKIISLISCAGLIPSFSPFHSIFSPLICDIILTMTHSLSLSQAETDRHQREQKEERVLSQSDMNLNFDLMSLGTLG